jgi:hypothetical protein
LAERDYGALIKARNQRIVSSPISRDSQRFTSGTLDTFGALVASKTTKKAVKRRFLHWF